MPVLPRCLAFAACLPLLATAAPAAQEKTRTSAEVLDASAPADWRPLDPENTLYVELASGRVVLELAPAFAPRHVANIKALVREHYFDGLPIIRVQDNYVVQWGDPDGKRDVGKASRTLAAEFFRKSGADLPFTRLRDGDIYAPQVGHSAGFPAARDPKKGQAWLAHCYGMLGVGRDNGADSGGGTELYVVTGHAPRHLDRNITLAGRVVRGIELLSSLPRGTGALGFYEKPEQYVPITAVRVAADVPEAERTALELLRTDGPTWAAWVDSRRNRREEWFLEPTGHVELCNVPIPVRDRK
ncbi:MAG TPA: peptidylprolyl isomerase [Candidatus Binatia bacterium]|nr:peptidylprolyl isomerase [Candidatus Binatia bacterium]